MKYTANIEGIQKGLMKAVAEHDGWITKDPPSFDPENDILRSVVDYFEDLEMGGVVQRYMIDIAPCRNSKDMHAYLVEVDCFFPEECTTDTLTFRCIVKG